MDLLRAGERSSAELRQALGLKHRGSFRNNYLQPAIERGLVEYTIPGKHSSRLQQYRLTDRGRRWLEEAKTEV
ncbi:MAG: hypothetical protein GY708_25955 [Actinomycetia bacterium]|nr:hypothetical protein [Actinomycetes bacterium]